jgi:hypothetical protein
LAANISLPKVTYRNGWRIWRRTEIEEILPSFLSESAPFSCGLREAQL